MFAITTQRPEDTADINLLLDQAFGPDRRNKPSYRYRQGVAPHCHLSLVARDNGRVVGTIQYWPVQIGEQAEALLLGPLAVAADCGRQGIGKTLIWQSLDLAVWARQRIVLLVGDPAYYGRFGFIPAECTGIDIPGATGRLQIMALAPNALDGICGPVRPWRSVRGRFMKAA